MKPQSLKWESKISLLNRTSQLLQSYQRTGPYAKRHGQSTFLCCWRFSQSQSSSYPVGPINTRTTTTCFQRTEQLVSLLYMTHTYQIVNIGNKEHKIITGSYPEQCDTYFKAIENRDFYSAYMLHMPYIERDCKMIQFEIDMLTRKQTLDDELDIISCLPKELLELEMKIKTT